MNKYCFRCRLVAFGNHFGAHWILKGIPKVSIFGDKKHKIIKKKCPRKGYGTKTMFLSTFDAKNWRPEMVKRRFAHYTCCNLRDWGGHENWSPNDIKKTSKFESLASKGPFFEIFMDLGWLVCLLCFGGSPKAREPHANTCRGWRV